jgi:transcription elongation factor GreA-like protein
MIIKRGNVVSHTGGVEWGAGKVMEVTALKATIQFSDGIIRKIASSHYTILQPADSALFVSPADSLPTPKVRVAAKRVKKVKATEAVVE